MKKAYYVMMLVLAAVLMIFPLMAVAQETAVVATAANDGAYDWSQLATIAGATAATLLIVQFIKLPLDNVWKVPTRAVVYLIALIIMLGAEQFTKGLTIAAVPLLAINAFVVALAAMGSYELTFAKGDQPSDAE